MIQNKKKNTGFTLIELLVVVSIIAMLLAVMMPALNRARRQARQIICRNNIRQVLIGLNAFATDGNRYPEHISDAAPFKIWKRGESTEFLHVFKDYIVSGAETPDFTYCPLRNRSATELVGGLYPGLSDPNGQWTRQDIEFSKYLYVKDTGYFMGYSLFAGLKDPDGRTFLRWDKSGNTDRTAAPSIAGSSRDVIVADFVQLRTTDWYAPHADKRTRFTPGGLYAWGRLPTIPKAPEEFGDLNVGFGDGHVENRTETQHYVDTINTTDKRWYVY